MAQLVVTIEVLLTDRHVAVALTLEHLPPLSPSLSTILRELPTTHETKGQIGTDSILLLWEMSVLINSSCAVPVGVTVLHISFGTR